MNLHNTEPFLLFSNGLLRAERFISTVTTFYSRYIPSKVGSALKMKSTAAYPELLVLYSHLNTHEIEAVYLIASCQLDCSNAPNVSLMRALGERIPYKKKSPLLSFP